MKFFGVISTSAPHIYISALPLCPQKAIIHKLYKEYAHPLVRVVQGLPISWDVILATIYRDGLARGATWSPCSRFFAISTPGAVEILDGATLEHLNTFKSPEHWCEDLLFSPDSHTLTQPGLGEQKLMCWDLQTGVLVSSPPSAEACDRALMFPYAYSKDGRILVICCYWYEQARCINTYDIFSGTHTGSYPPPEGHIIKPFWTHGEHFCFAAVNPGSITVWEASFTSVNTPAIVKTLPAPDDSLGVSAYDFLFLPSLSHLAFVTNKSILIWDGQGSKFLLRSEQSTFRGPTISFSSDGHFFSAGDNQQNAWVWKRYPDSYILHQRVALPLMFMTILLSPDGESIIAVGSSLVCLWHTRDQILSPSPSRIPVEDHFLLGFSPNEVLAASAQYRGTTVTIFDLQSGDPQLIIDTGMKIECLRLMESTVIIADTNNIITWNIPTKDCIETRVGVTESVYTIDLSPPSFQGHGYSNFHNLEIKGSISPDGSHIAILSNHTSIKIYDVSTGRQLAATEGGDILMRPGSVALKGSEVWYMGVTWSEYTDEPVKGWKIIWDSKSSIDKLEPLEATIYPPPVFPWQSCIGYEITHDGWVLSPTQKRLLWLPHHWRSKYLKTWGGRFLGLIHKELPEAVILEFLK